ncbi:MAG: UDP-glucose 4-epimerase GalE [Acidobacteria bacterium]|nr:UDP-glucose 4-epimerase GalE [Acidobacteriota bacterium]MCB9397310.1 UDP-glucose 4-epimerase GalE [Acidobacteriota bacterium]
MREKVLVVGGAGYIGSHVTDALLRRGFKVAVFDNLSSGSIQNLCSDAEFFWGDLRDEARVQQVFEGFRPTVVMHFAAKKAAGESMIRPELYADHNIIGSIYLLNAMVQFGVKTIIFSSSAAVYGNPQYLPMDESHPLQPVNFYGFTKKAIEDLLDWYFRLHGIRYAALRYFNAAGVDVAGKLLGFESNPANLVPLIMQVYRGQRPFLEVYGNDYDTPDGSCLRDYVHVTDLSEAHLAAMEYLMAKGTPLIANLGTENAYSVLQVVEALEKLTGQVLPVRIVGRREGDPPALYAACGYAESLINWSPRYSDLETILSSSLEASKRWPNR